MYEDEKALINDHQSCLYEHFEPRQYLTNQTMIEALRIANQESIDLLAGDVSFDANQIIATLKNKLLEQLGGWMRFTVGDIRGRIPLVTEEVLDQFEGAKREELETLIQALQFEVDGQWYCFANARGPNDDMWGIEIPDLALYVQARVRSDRVDSYDTGKSSREFMDEHDWLLTILMVMRGLWLNGEPVVASEE